MQKLRRQTASFALLVILFIPLFSESVHAAFHANEQHCSEKQTQHLHALEHHCAICDFMVQLIPTLNTVSDATPIYFSKGILLSFFILDHLTSGNKYFSEDRGPPARF